MGYGDHLRERIRHALGPAKAAALRGGVDHGAWSAVADAEAYLRGAPTFIAPDAIAEALARYATRSDGA